MPAPSPSSGQEFAVLAVADPADVDDAAAAAAAAWPEWARASAFDRAAWSERVAAGIRGRRDQLARALTEDQGKRCWPRHTTTVVYPAPGLR
jgi:acyl-CoA reductase-like NAD-dependent aldehyde dehydrogenase